jgi:hypothetical protein
LTAYNGDLVVNTPGAVISGLKINGTVIINAPGVTIENCSITSTGFAVVNIKDGVTGTVVQNCTISGTGAGPQGQNGIGGGGTFLNNNISGVENGIDVGGSNTVVKGNYIHDLNDSAGSVGHYDGIQVNGGFNNVLISGNTVYGRDTSCIFICNDFGPMDNIVVDGNLFFGQNNTAYTVYVIEKADNPAQVTNVKVTNNVLGDGYYGFASVERTEPVWTNNTDYVTGKLVSKDGELSSAPVTPPSAPGAPAITKFSTDSGATGDHITNDNTLILTGSAVANSTVKVFDGSTQVGMATANSSGAWTLTTTALPNGSHSLAATATTSAGTSSKSAPLSVKIDNVAPSAPTITASAAAATLSQASTQLLTGTAEANSTITVFDGTAKIGTATANASGAWSFTAAALSTGSHSITAAATDVAGNTSVASKAVAVTVAAAPTAPAAPKIASYSTDSGVAGDGITKDNTLELKGTAAAGSTVKIYDGSNQLGSTTADSKGNWDYITKVLTDAKHTLTATATNSSGQTGGASSAQTVTVDTHAPGAPTIAGNSVNAAKQVVLKGTAEADSMIKVYDGMTQVGTATANSSGEWSTTTSALSAGSHVLTAKATDVAGNVSVASSAVKPVIGGSSTPPAAPKIASFSKDTGVIGDHITSDKTVTLTGSAVANSTVKVYDGTTQLGTVTADAKGAWTYTTTALRDGKHSFTATDTVSGATSAKSGALALTVDTAAPNAPVLLSDSIKDHRATVTGTAEAGSTVKVYEGATLLGATTAGADGNFSVTTSGLKNGSHTFIATAKDAAGNTSALSKPLDPDVGNPATTVIESLGSAGLLQVGSNFSIDSSGHGTGPLLKFGGALVDTSTRSGLGAEQTATGYQVVWKIGADLYSIWNTDQQGNELSYVHVTGSSSSLKALEPKFHQDLNGDGVIGVAAPPPVKATVDLTNVYQNWNNTATVKGTADPNSHIKLYDGTEAVGSVTAGTDGKWSFKTADLSNKTHTFTGLEADSAGHPIGTSSGAAIVGTSAGNTLPSTKGDDVLVGKGGMDTFVFASGFGNDLIKDFGSKGVRHDTVEFSKSVFDSFASVLAHATQSGHDVVISTGSDTLTLKNTKLDALNSHDFHFA